VHENNLFLKLRLLIKYKSSNDLKSSIYVTSDQTLCIA